MDAAADPFPSGTPAEALGSTLRVYRREARLTQGALAMRASVSQSTISLVESGRYVPGDAWLGKVAEGLRLDDGREAWVVRLWYRARVNQIYNRLPFPVPINPGLD